MLRVARRHVGKDLQTGVIKYITRTAHTEALIVRGTGYDIGHDLREELGLAWDLEAAPLCQLGRQLSCQLGGQLNGQLNGLAFFRRRLLRGQRAEVKEPGP